MDTSTSVLRSLPVKFIGAFIALIIAGIGLYLVGIPLGLYFLLSNLIYAGAGLFKYEEDILNMVHVFEDLEASGWTPPAGMKFPPRKPNRDFSHP